MELPAGLLRNVSSPLPAKDVAPRHHGALAEDAHGTAAAALGIEPRDDLSQRLDLRAEDVFGTDAPVAAAAPHHLDHLSLDRAEIELPTVYSKPVGLLAEHLASRNVYEVDAAAHDQNVGLFGMSLDDAVEFLGDMIYRTEEDRSVYPEDLQLGAFGQRLLLDIDQAPLPAVGIGHKSDHMRMGGAVQIEKKRQKHAHVYCKLQFYK